MGFRESDIPPELLARATVGGRPYAEAVAQRQARRRRQGAALAPPAAYLVDSDGSGLCFTVYGWLPPTLNSIVFGTVQSRARLMRHAREVLMHACATAGIIPAQRMRRVRMTIVASLRRARDVDAYWKATLDGLTHARALRDDSAEWVQIAPVVFETGIVKSTRIVLEDIQVAGPAT